jgi:hypothetical protein
LVARRLLLPLPERLVAPGAAGLLLLSCDGGRRRC